MVGAWERAPERHAPGALAALVFRARKLLLKSARIRFVELRVCYVKRNYFTYSQMFLRRLFASAGKAGRGESAPLCLAGDALLSQAGLRARAAGMDRTSYDTILHDLGDEPISDGAELRARLVPAIRDVLDGGRREAERRLVEDGGGLACARGCRCSWTERCALVHDAVVHHLYPAHNPSSSERLAVVATGGYGRGTMAPGSDVDLLFLLPHKKTAWSESVVEAILYVLWDLKLKVGHATRSVDECLREGRGDMTIRTSLLEARYPVRRPRPLRRPRRALRQRDRRAILGASSSTRSCASATRASPRPAPRATSSSRTSRTARAACATSTRCSGSPSTSIACARRKSSCRRACSRRRSSSLFARCEEFLWRVRCHMHFVTGRAEERLTFDLQRVVAARIGASDRGGLVAVERFMKRYFLIAKDVGDLTAIVCAELEARQAKRRPVLDRVLGRFRRRRGGAARRATTSSSTTTASTSRTEDAFERDPVNLIRLFWLADRHNLPVHPDATRLATRSLRLIGPSLRKDAGGEPALPRHPDLAATRPRSCSGA